MTIRSALVLATLAALAVGVSGCPSSSCPMESPQVNGLPASCTAPVGQQVSYPVRLCPTCNQSSASCAVDLSAATTTGDIFLDTKVEACSGSSSCPPACQTNPILCTFTPPGAGTYKVTVFDGATGQTQTSQLVVSQGGASSCAFPTAGI
jgi:hypothetical protein